MISSKNARPTARSGGIEMEIVRLPKARRRLAMMLLVSVAAFVIGTGAIDTADAALTYFVCSPTHVAAFDTRIHVRCSTPAETTVYYFAVCAASDSAFASRVLSVFTSAKVTGKQLAIYYNPADTSGTSCGCSTADCRVIQGAEVMP